MASTRSYGGNGTPVDEQSLGELVATATRDVSLLVHQEIELAKTELTDQATKAGISAGLLAGAGFGALLAVVLASFAGAFGFSDGFDIPIWAGFLCMTGVYIVVAVVLGIVGYRRMKRLKGLERAKASVQTDLALVKSPTVKSPTVSSPTVSSPTLTP